MKYDFSGAATRYGIKCSDGRTIMHDAFKDNDGKCVPLVWNHCHDNPENVLGKALLHNEDDCVRAYCAFNSNPRSQQAKELVEHGDVVALSIFANNLNEMGKNVKHGLIREVSIVLAGANPGAYIDSVYHSDGSEDGAIIVCHDYSEEDLSIEHGEIDENALIHSDGDNSDEDNDSETIGDILKTCTDKQKEAISAILALTLDEGDDDEDDENKEGDNSMKHNVFEQNKGSMKGSATLSHADQAAIISDGKRYGSLKESVIAHAADYGIDNIDYLFPDDKTLTNEPVFVERDTDWVSDVMANVHHSPFSRVKSIFADITEDEARARGYVKGKFKKEEVFSLLKRSTSPTTVYKKQKIDRDDYLDITTFDAVVFLKKEMRGMLNEELARAYLFGDGRLASSDDKISEEHIRPIYKDSDLFTIKSRVIVKGNDTPTDEELARELIDQSARAMALYRGSGSPTGYMRPNILTACLLLKDNNGRRIYSTADEVAAAMRVKKIVEVPVMDFYTRTENGDILDLLCLIVNLKDYNVGTDRGGEVNMFDNFDIDYNQQKYLMETRCSGAMIRPLSAISLETKHIS